MTAKAEKRERFIVPYSDEVDKSIENVDFYFPIQGKTKEN